MERERERENGLVKTLSPVVCMYMYRVCYNRSVAHMLHPSLPLLPDGSVG